MARVNAFTQWGKLKRIMVGRSDHACFQPPQPGHKPEINDPYLAQHLPWPTGPKLKSMTDAAEVQLQGLIDVLHKEGVETVRPAEVDWTKPINTPEWSSPNQYCSVCPRDTMITFGNVMMEATMSRRDRFFEFMAYRPQVDWEWKNDPKSLWKAAPKCSMNDDMYDASWLDLTEAERFARLHNREFCLKMDKEIVFDAADFTRTGKHIFGQISMTTNTQALKWLHRELAPHGFVVHPIRIQYDTTPSHIDCTFVVLRPGLVMLNPDRPVEAEDAKFWTDNGWEFIMAPQPNNPEKPAYSQSSKWLSMNVLVIDHNKVIVEQEEEDTQKLLQENGFDVIPIPFRDVFEFGGSLHCSTWDMEREDSQVDLFPTFDIENSEWHQSL